MDHSEARRADALGIPLRIFRLSGEAEFVCIFSEVPASELRDQRSGLGSTARRFYASALFLQIFCDEAHIFPRPNNDDLFLITLDSLRSYDAAIIADSVLIWTDGPQVPDVVPPAPPPAARTEDVLNSVSFNFRAALTLPSGVRAPYSVRSWSYGLRHAELSHMQYLFVRHVTNVYRMPASTHRPISYSYIKNIESLLLKLWGVCMNHLGFTEPDTRTLKIIAPQTIGYYFRFLANPDLGRNMSHTTIELERQALKHLAAGLATLSYHKRHLGLTQDDLPWGVTLSDCQNFINHQCRQVRYEYEYDIILYYRATRGAAIHHVLCGALLLLTSYSSKMYLFYFLRGLLLSHALIPFILVRTSFIDI